MKKKFALLIGCMIALILVFCACENSVTNTKDNSDASFDYTTVDIVEADIVITQSGQLNKEVVNELRRNDDSHHVVEGVIEYYLDGQKFAIVDFGIGENDNYATKIQYDDVTEINLDKTDDDKYEKIVVEPIVKSDDCDYIIAGLIEIYKNGELIYSIDFGDGECDNIAIVTRGDKVFEIDLDKKRYNKGGRKRGEDKKDHDREDFVEVIVEPLEKIDGCDYIVSGIVEMYKDEELICTIDYGDGECDNIATITRGDKVYEINLDGRKDKDRKDDVGKGKGFEFVYPITFVMPDGSTITVEDKEGMMAVREWYKENPGSKEKPALQFPVNIVMEDGTTLTINSQEEMDALMRKFHGDRKDDDGKGKGFEFVYPINFVMPDGSTITVEDKDGMMVVREWYKENPESKEKPALQFPVDIVLEDGTTLTINSQEEMDELMKRLHGDRKNNGGRGKGNKG